MPAPRQKECPHCVREKPDAVINYFNEGDTRNEFRGELLGYSLQRADVRSSILQPFKWKTITGEDGATSELLFNACRLTHIRTRLAVEIHQCLGVPGYAVSFAEWGTIILEPDKILELVKGAIRAFRPIERRGRKATITPAKIEAALKRIARSEAGQRKPARLTWLRLACELEIPESTIRGYAKGWMRLEDFNRWKEHLAQERKNQARK